MPPTRSYLEALLREATKLARPAPGNASRDTLAHRMRLRASLSLRLSRLREDYQAAGLSTEAQAAEDALDDALEGREAAA